MSANLMKQIRALCTPAYVYLVVSLVIIMVMMLQNRGRHNTYCVGSYQCDVPSTIAVFVGKLIYVAFWTFILHALCKAGYRQVSWVLVLFPFLLFFVMLGFMVTRGIMSSL
jgi:hypothetical protein